MEENALKKQDLSEMICGNTDTGLLKLVAVVTMLIDHIGSTLFPYEPLWRMIGRLSWPLFAYCLVVGFLCTHDLKKYTLRLTVFAFISQAPYLLAFEDIFVTPSYWPALDPIDFWQDFPLNIFFTMLLGVLAMYGLREKKYLLTAAALGLGLLPAVSYGIRGVLLVVLIYLLITKNIRLFAAGVGLFMLAYLFTPPYWPSLFYGLDLNIQGLCLFSLPLMCLHTHTGWKLPKYFYYVFYPLHLLILGLIK